MRSVADLEAQRSALEAKLASAQSQLEVDGESIQAAETSRGSLAAEAAE